MHTIAIRSQHHHKNSSKESSTTTQAANQRLRYTRYTYLRRTYRCTYLAHTEPRTTAAITASQQHYEVTISTVARVVCTASDDAHILALQVRSILCCTTHSKQHTICMLYVASSTCCGEYHTGTLLRVRSRLCCLRTAVVHIVDE